MSEEFMSEEFHIDWQPVTQSTSEPYSSEDKILEELQCIRQLLICIANNTSRDGTYIASTALSPQQHHKSETQD